MALDDFVAWALDENGDILVSEDEFGIKAVEKVTGIDCVKQSIIVRLTARPRDSILHPEVGFDAARVMGVFNAPFLRLKIIEAIAPDPNVGPITSIDLEFDGRTRVVDAVIELSAVDSDTGEIVPIIVQGAVL